MEAQTTKLEQNGRRRQTTNVSGKTSEVHQSSSYEHISIVDSDCRDYGDMTPKQYTEFYKSLGDWKNVLPKTDYAYSPQSQFYTKRVNGVPIIPNMSRVPIWEVGNVEPVDENEYSPETMRVLRSSRTKYWRYRTWSFVKSNFTALVTHVARCSSWTMSRTTVLLTKSKLKTFLVEMTCLFLLMLLGYYVITLVPELLSSANNLVCNLNDLLVSSSKFAYNEISGFSSNVVEIVCSVLFTPAYKLFHPSGGNENLDSSAETASFVMEERVNDRMPGQDFEERFKLLFNSYLEKHQKGDDEFKKMMMDRIASLEKSNAFSDVSALKSKLKDIESILSQIPVKELEGIQDKMTISKKELQDVENKLLILFSILGADTENYEELKEKYKKSRETDGESQLKTEQLRQTIETVKERSQRTAEEVSSILEHLKVDLWNLIEKRLQINERSKADVDLDEVDIKIKKALAIYDADKTGKPDFALESYGGIILSTRCTETKISSAQFSVFGIPLWKETRGPRTVIQPGVHPGECWAFSGSTGFLVIQLRERIYVTGFTVEHIPKRLASNGTIDSAMKDFTVWGLVAEMDPEPELLGQFTFEEDGDSVQYFEAMLSSNSYHIVELKILSNHGNLDYTCLYRFRVHGVPAS